MSNLQSANPGEDYIGALEAVQSALSSHRVQLDGGAAPTADIAPWRHHAAGLAAVVGALLPENAIVVDESIPRDEA